MTSDNESLTDPSNQNEDIINQGETLEDDGKTGEDIINQEETLGDNGRTGEDNGTTNETTSNTESLTDPSNKNQDNITDEETSTYTPDEIIEMTKQTSDQADTSSDQTISASSPIIYIPKTLILGQDGSCDYIV